MMWNSPKSHLFIGKINTIVLSNITALNGILGFISPFSVRLLVLTKQGWTLSDSESYKASPNT